MDAPYLLMNSGERDYVQMVWAEVDRAGGIHRACLLDDADYKSIRELPASMPALQVPTPDGGQFAVISR